MAMANNYKILYSAYIVGYKTFKNKDQNIENAIHFHVPCNKNMLESLNFNNINYLELLIYFKKLILTPLIIFINITTIKTKKKVL